MLHHRNSIKELNIDKHRITGVSQVHYLECQDDGHDRAPLCFSITPYLFEYKCEQPEEKYIQLLIQRRITTLSDQYLVKRDQLPHPDVEAAVEMKKYQKDACTWLFPYLLLIGLVASVMGYVGCLALSRIDPRSC